MFDRVLIANRGEIACRIARTARRMGMDVAAVYSDADQGAPHVDMAQASVRLPGVDAADTYLNIDLLLEAARKTESEAIHPGYGFLAENPGFARSVREAGFTFVGPSAEVIEAMGMKRRAKNLMEEAGVPVVPDERGENQDPDHLAARAEEIGFPVLIKAVSGGGGKGMRRVDDPGDFHDALAACRREAKSAFDDDRVLVEKYVTDPRHVEVQVFGDQFGNGVHLFERDCSVQRRYQKVVEEAPAPGIPPATRRELGETAVRAVDALEYTGAGTMEFILDASSPPDEADFYFMEMNTRLQVEHPVTEMITGEDLVEWQFRVAAGEPLPEESEQLSTDGHAFEARIYAEDPANDFRPRTGTIRRFVRPDESDRIRLDSGVREGSEVHVHYDPLLAKLIVHGEDRDSARRRMERALSETGLAGLTTNTEMLINVFRQKAFQESEVRTDFIDRHRSDLIPGDYGRARRAELVFAAVHFLSGGPGRASERSSWTDPWDRKNHWRMNTARRSSLALRDGDRTVEFEATCGGREYELTFEQGTVDVKLLEVKRDWMTIDVNGRRRHAVLVGDRDERHVTVLHDGRAVSVRAHLPELETAEREGEGEVRASMPGKVIEVLVEEGEEVERKDALLVMEAMKMEMTVQAERSGMVSSLRIGSGDQVREGDLLVSIE